MGIYKTVIAQLEKQNTASTPVVFCEPLPNYITSSFSKVITILFEIPSSLSLFFIVVSYKKLIIPNHYILFSCTYF